MLFLAFGLSVLNVQAQESAPEPKDAKQAMQQIIDAYDRIHDIPRNMYYDYRIESRSLQGGDVKITGKAHCIQHQDKARWETLWEHLDIEGNGKLTNGAYHGYNMHKLLWVHDGKKTVMSYLQREGHQISNEKGQKNAQSKPVHFHLDHEQLDKSLPQRFTAPLKAPEFIGVLMSEPFKLSKEPLNGKKYMVIRGTRSVEVSHSYTWDKIAFFVQPHLMLVERMEVTMSNHSAPEEERFIIDNVLDLAYQFPTPEDKAVDPAIFTVESLHPASLQQDVKHITKEVNEFGKTQLKK
jgi:hypothetical protein